jgi:cardiolipin synthase
VPVRELTEHNEQFIKLNQALGGLPVMGGNGVRFLEDYQQSIDELIKDINGAKQRILFEFFIVALDETTIPVWEALEAAVQRGVDVRVLFDGVVSRHYPNFRQLKKRLTAAGIKWKPMLPINLKPGKHFTRPDLRNHRKIVVIDGIIGYTGSQNIVDKTYHRSDELYYEELVARVTGPVVWQLAAIFRADWYAETREFLPQDPIAERSGNVAAQVLPSGPGHGGSSNLKLYTSLMHSAEKKIVIVTPYFVPDDALLTALTSAAERGVEVTIINSEIIDKLLVGHAQRSYYSELLRVGIKIYLYKTPVFLHSKHVTIDDDVAVIGSSNLDIRSFELDQEVTLVMYDKKVVQQLRKIEHRYAANSSQVNPYSWARRPFYLQSLDTLARLTAVLQ